METPAGYIPDYGWTAGQMPGVVHRELIACGGFGEVHKMEDTLTGEVFARKLVRLFGGVTREDIGNEARAVAKLCGPDESLFIVQVFNHDWLPRNPSYYYIDMEYCSETLENHITSKDKDDFLVDLTRLSEKFERHLFEKRLVDVLEIGHQIAEGLAYIHEQNAVHRDLKPRNVLYSRKNKCWKIADFGSVSEATSKHLNTTQYRRGTSCYRAPEVLEDVARYNNKADIWALGCILHEVSTGRKLFSSDWSVSQFTVKGGTSHWTIWWEILQLVSHRVQGVLVGSRKSLYDAPWQAKKPEWSPVLAFKDFFHQLQTILTVDPNARPKAKHLALTWVTALIDQDPNYYPPANPYWSLEEIALFNKARFDLGRWLNPLMPYLECDKQMARELGSKTATQVAQFREQQIKVFQVRFPRNVAPPWFGWTPYFSTLLRMFGLDISFDEYISCIPSSTRLSIAHRASELLPYYHTRENRDRPMICNFVHETIDSSGNYNSILMDNENFTTNPAFEVPMLQDLDALRPEHLHVVSKESQESTGDDNSSDDCTPRTRTASIDTNLRKRKTIDGDEMTYSPKRSDPLRARDRLSLHELLCSPSPPGLSEEKVGKNEPHPLHISTSPQSDS